MIKCALQRKRNQIKSNVGFGGEGKTGVSGENLSEQSREPTNSGYVHTGPVPNGSDPKLVPDRPFVHTGPANRTVNPFPIRSENWTSKKAGPVLEPFRSQTDPSPCKHLNRPIPFGGPVTV